MVFMLLPFEVTQLAPYFHKTVAGLTWQGTAYWFCITDAWRSLP